IVRVLESVNCNKIGVWKSYFQDRKAYFNQACDDFMVNHPGQTITLKDMAGLVGSAHPRAFTPMNIIWGFSKTGIYPSNALIFSDNDYLSSSVTDRPSPSTVANQRSSDRERTPEPDINEPQSRVSSQERTPELSPGNSGFYKTPEDIRPLPKAPPRKKQACGRKAVKTKILTDTSNMKEINDSFIKKQQKNKNKINQVKRNISSDNATNLRKKQKPVN
ncbi:hypothetical protein CBL_21493, partial [Carabus blaptoides fortunei]